MYIQGEPKLSDYFVFNITTQWIVIQRSIKDDKIAKFMEIYMLTVHIIFTKALLCPRPFPHGTHFWTYSIQCDVLPRPSLAHMLLWISTDGALSGTFQLIDVLGCFSRHQLLRSVLRSGVSLILTRALERGLRITPPEGGGAYNAPIDLSSYESCRDEFWRLSRATL